MIEIRNKKKSAKIQKQRQNIKTKYLTKKGKNTTAPKKNNLILKPITNLDEKSLYQIVRNPSVMKYVGNGKPWSLSKVKKYISYNLEEDKINSNDTRDYYSFKIIDSNNPKLILGIIEFHLFPQLSISHNSYKKYKNLYFLTIYLHPKSQGKGVAIRSINLLIEKIKEVKPNLKTLYSMVNINNDKMVKFSEKHQFKLVNKHISFHNKKFNIYQINVL